MMQKMVQMALLHNLWVQTVLVLMEYNGMILVLKESV